MGARFLALGDRAVPPRDGERGRHDGFQQPRVFGVERRAVGQPTRQARERVDGERDLVSRRGARARPEAAEVLEGRGARLVKALDLDLDVLAVFEVRFFFFVLDLF